MSAPSTVLVEAMQLVNAGGALRTARQSIETALAALALSEPLDGADGDVQETQRARCRESLSNAWHHLEIVFADYLRAPLAAAEAGRDIGSDEGEPLPQ